MMIIIIIIKKSIHSEAATGGVLLEKLLEISQNSQENTCASVSFFNKDAVCNFIKKRASGTGVFL